MNCFCVFLFLPALLFTVVSCSHERGGIDVKGGKGVLNCQDYKNLIIAPVVIDGKKCHLLVDTGASHTLLRKDVVRKFWPEKSVKHLGGKTVSNIDSPLFVTPIGSLSSESLDAHNFYAIVAEVPHLGNIGGEPVAGMLGMDILGSLPMLIDVDGGKITFFEKAPTDAELKAMGAVRVPIIRDGNHVRSLLVLDGNPIYAIIDTGATQSCIPRNLWEKKTKKTQTRMEWVDVNGINHFNDLDYGVINRLKWGDVTFPNMFVFFETSEKIMGGDVLRKGKLFVDIRSNTAWWISH